MVAYKNKFSPLRVLVVDDDPVHHAIMRELLEAIGVRHYAFAKDGLSALVQLRSPQVFQIVLLDNEMPGMDGQQLIKAIRDDPDIRNLRLAMINGGGTPEEVRELDKFLWQNHVLHLKKEVLGVETLSWAIGTLVDF